MFWQKDDTKRIPENHRSMSFSPLPPSWVLTRVWIRSSSYYISDTIWAEWNERSERTYSVLETLFTTRVTILPYFHFTHTLQKEIFSARLFLYALASIHLLLFAIDVHFKRPTSSPRTIPVVQRANKCWSRRTKAATNETFEVRSSDGAMLWIRRRNIHWSDQSGPHSSGSIKSFPLVCWRIDNFHLPDVITRLSHLSLSHDSKIVWSLDPLPFFSFQNILVDQVKLSGPMKRRVDLRSAAPSS